MYACQPPGSNRLANSWPVLIPCVLSTIACLYTGSGTAGITSFLALFAVESCAVIVIVIVLVLIEACAGSQLHASHAYCEVSRSSLPAPYPASACELSISVQLFENVSDRGIGAAALHGDLIAVLIAL